ncbi:type II toxin-antitoxin system Phd/YefM family antitoxin [Streptomyces sp. NBC_01012]|nr:type II toxin-antitoxin system Phd/YefM family antitoxin [Streptomyces sp. NBC_01012]
MAYEIPVTQARADLAELINRVVYGGERVVVTRHGKPLVALVSAADLQRLEDDEAAAREAAAEEQAISSVSSFGSVSSAPGERHRFGIAAEHHGSGHGGSEYRGPEHHVSGHGGPERRRPEDRGR